MWLADGWKDYEVIDCASGEKLERWGGKILVRPDPQVIWKTEKNEKGWKSFDGHYHRNNKGGGEWEFKNVPDKWNISYDFACRRLPGEKKLSFWLQPFTFKHTGLFPEQAVNWDFFGKIISEAKAKEPDREIKVLNLFAYTGGATLAAAAAGASVTHVDASKGMVGWAKDNAVLSGLSDAPIRYFVDDCVKLVERELRRGNKYDGIIMDPPSYGRGPKGEIWKIEDSVYDFIRLTEGLVSDRPRFFLLNSYTTGLQPAVMKYMLETEIVSKHGGRAEADEIGLPVTSTGLVLPCGASARVVF